MIKGESPEGVDVEEGSSVDVLHSAPMLPQSEQDSGSANHDSTAIGGELGEAAKKAKIDRKKEHVFLMVWGIVRQMLGPTPDRRLKDISTWISERIWGQVEPQRGEKFIDAVEAMTRAEVRMLLEQKRRRQENHLLSPKH